MARTCRSRARKFIYYDGLFPQGKWLKIGVAKDRVSLTSQVKHPVFDITVVDRRGDKVRVGRVAQLAAGETINDLEFAEADASRFTSEAGDMLVKQLVAAGLFEDEATFFGRISSGPSCSTRRASACSTGCRSGI